jgi:carboxyl-terminal processing protease
LRLTVARYYRPNGENIHRGKDATEEDPWGVQPDEGLEVELDDAALERLARRWREASYPSLASLGVSKPGSQSLSSEVSDPPTDQPLPNSDSQDDPLSEPQSPESALSIDAQLKRAVDHLRQQSAQSSVVPTAA